MFKYLIKEKRTFSLLAADLIVLSGVVFMHWNPARMIAFYYLDTCFCILSFVGYMILIKNVPDFSVVLMATAMILFIMYFFFLGLVEVSNKLNFENHHTSPVELFFPYYDVALFITCSAGAHIFNVRKYLSYKESVAKPAFEIYVGLMIFLVTMLFILTIALEQSRIPLKISLILSLLLIRHYSEYKRYKSFQEIEAEIKSS